MSIVAFGRFGLVVAGVLVWAGFVTRDEWPGYVFFGLLFAGCCTYAIVIQEQSPFKSQWLSSDPLLDGDVFRQSYGAVLLMLLIAAPTIPAVRRRTWPLFGKPRLPAANDPTVASRITEAPDNEPPT